MKKLVITAVITLGLTVSSFAQGYFNFDNSANFDGSINAAISTVGPLGHAGEGAIGAAIGSDLSFATPNYDVSFLWLNGTANVGSPLTPSQFITAGALLPLGIGNTSPPNFASYIAVTGDEADGAGITSAGNGYTSLSGEADGQLITLQLIAWYDPTGNTTFAAALAAGYNTGGSALRQIRLAAGTDLTVADLSGFAGFQVQAVPEPTTFAMMGLGALSLVLFRRRK